MDEIRRTVCFDSPGAGTFRGERIEFDMDGATTPLSIALGDIDLDGDVDLYVSGYIRVDKMEGETNFDTTYGGVSYLLVNEGDSTWVDRTVAAGVYRRHNTFTALFVDLDGDTYPELVVAEDTGVVETWRNQGDGTFERTENPSVHSYPMGLAAGGFDGDADIDLFFSNVGSTLPEMMLRGNLGGGVPLNMDYMLFLNDGEMGFTDVATAAGVARLGFGWGVNACDFDNDGRLDLYVAQNYVKFPAVQLLELYPGRLMLQGEGFHFTPVEEVAGLSNQNFGITQVISDFNQDGWPDIVLGNVNGPTRAFLSGGGDEAWLQVRLPDGAAWLHTRVTVTASDGSTWTRQSHASEGLASDSTDLLLFGLGDVEGEVSLEIAAPGKPVQRLPGVPVRTVLDVTP